MAEPRSTPSQTRDVDVVLMDLSMPVLDGVAATREVLQAKPEYPGGRALVVLGPVPGARGDSGGRDRLCAEGLRPGRALSPRSGRPPPDTHRSILGSPARCCRVRTRATGSPRARPRCCGWPAKGMANKQIARALGITERTVKVHLGNVFRRIGVADRTSAALWARENLT